MVQKFRKKPVVIEAIKWNNINYEEISAFVGYEITPELESETAYAAGKGAPIFSLTIKTLEGKMKAMPGDFIIKGVNGEFYPCKPDIFEKTYSMAEENEETIVFNKKTWDDFKLMLGSRTYNGLINLEDLVEVTGKLEDKRIA